MTNKRTLQILSLVALVSLLAGLLPADSTPAKALPDVQSPVPIRQNGCYAVDLDCDHDVDEADVTLVADHWNCAIGDPCYDVAYDLDGNGVVDAFDLAWVANDYDIEPPLVTIVSPVEDQVVGGTTLLVSGTVSDTHAVVAVTVNGVEATLAGNAFDAIVPLDSGNQVLNVVAEDEVGQVGLASRVIGVDGDGPLIEIHEPQHRQAVYTLTPSVTISYTDFYTNVNTASLSVLVIDEGGTPTDVTGDLMVAGDGAWGTLSAPLAEDAGYTLTVSLADAYGNVGGASAAFYVPPAPASIIPPEEPEGAGWVSGVVYDSSTCNEHLTTCEGLPGASVTLAYSGGLPITGTIVTGPDGFFAFPVTETAHYWLRVEKDTYTYGQRAAAVVRERSAATNEIYLTPIDPAVTYCNDSGCLHASSDGILQVEIPPNVIPPGEVVTTTATNYDHVEFLPSGELPPGTWETYAFNLGGDSEITFTQPITVRQLNYRGFAPGSEIPLGYWNQKTLEWEHEGFGIVDPTGTWVVMTMTHFSNHDPNYPVSVSEAEPDTEDKEEDDNECPEDEQSCTINLKSGTLHEDYTLPAVNVLGQEVAPTLLYNSSRADPATVIDVELSVNPGPGAELGDHVGFELYIEGKKTDSFVFSSTLESGEVGRYRYLWDGRDAQGNLLPPGVYEYRAKLSVPYQAQYCGTDRFGSPPDCVTRPTGVFVEATDDNWVRGTVELDAQSTGSLAAGWVLDGLQRLYEDEEGHILVTGGERSDEFYFPWKDLLIESPLPSKDNSVLNWVNSRSHTLQRISGSLAQDSQGATIGVGGKPYDVVLSSDGALAYITNQTSQAVSVVDLATQQVTATIDLGNTPYSIALSPEGDLAYVSQWANTLSVVDLSTQQVTATIGVGSGPYGVALSPDGAFAYVANRNDNTISVVDLATQQITATIGVGNGPRHVAISPDGILAYVTNWGSDTVSAVDLSTQQVTATINVGDMPYGVVFSPDGAFAYVTNYGSDTLSVIDVATQQELVTISVGDKPMGIGLSSDEDLAYIANFDDGTVSVVDVSTGQETTIIGVGDYPRNIALTADGAFAHVTHETNGTLSAIDLVIQQALTTISVGGNSEWADSVVLSPDEAFAYVTIRTDDAISVVDLTAQQEVASISVGSLPEGIALALDGAFAYVANRNDDTISVVDLDIQQETNTIGVGNYPQHIALSPDSAFAYVTNRDDDSVSVVDLSIQQATGTIGVGNAPHSIALSPDGSLAYVTNYWDNTVSKVDLIIQQELTTIAVGSSPQGIALSSEGNLACVANWGDDTISVLNLTTWQEVATINVGYRPYDVALSLDGAFAYVTNQGDNTVSVVDLVAQQEVATIGVGEEPMDIDVLGDFIPEIYSRTETDQSHLRYDPSTSIYSRHYPDGMQVYFNLDDTHDYTLEPDGRKTVYTYNPDGSVATMGIIPPGEETPRWTWTFSYASGKLSSIIDPAGRSATFAIDDHNHLTAITGPDGSSRQYAYNQDSLLTHFTDENGDVTTYTYDDYGRINSVIEPPRTVYNPTSRQVEVVQEVRNFTPSDTGYTLINDGLVGDPDNPAPPVPVSADLVDRVEYGRGSRSGHTNKWGNWLDETDGLDRTTTYQRDEANNLTRADYPDGTCVEYTYDAVGNMLTWRRMEPTQCTLPRTARNPDEVQTWTYSYEERFNQIKTETDPVSNTTTYIYDYEEGIGEAGNLIHIEYPPVENEYGVLVTPTVAYVYNEWSQVVTETNKIGTITVYRYTQGTPDEAYGQPGALFVEGVTPVPGLLTQIIRDYGGLDETTVYKDFDGAGNPLTVLGPGYVGGLAGGFAGGCNGCGTRRGGGLPAEGTETYYTYDAWGRVLTKKNALGIVTRYEYDAGDPWSHGNLLRRIEDYTSDGTAGRNVVTEYAYNAHGQILSERTAADGLVVETVNIYDINRQVAAQRDGLGHETVYGYDDADQLVSTKDPAGHETTYTYTPDGQIETMTDPEGSVTRYVYDGFGRLVTEIVDEGRLNLTMSYTYDLNDNLTTATDPAGTVTCYEYDSLSRLITETQDCGGLDLITTYAYNLNGNPAFVTDPRGVVTYYEYDDLGRVTLIRLDDGGLNLETHYAYDDAGNLVQMNDERGVVTAYTYDDLNRLVETCQDAQGLNLCTDYTYDSLSSQETATDPNGITTHIEHNAFGRPLRITDDHGGLNAATSYTYDHALNLIRVTDANGNTTRYGYTPNNQVETETYADGTTVGYTYDGQGNLDVRTDQEGNTTTHTYDGAGWLTGKIFSTGGSQTFGYDSVGRLTSAGETMNGHSSLLTYGHNPLGDVLSTTQTLDGVGWQVDYDYDYAGGVYTTTYPSGVQRVQELDALGRLDAVKQGDGSLVADYEYHDLDSYFTVAYPNGLTNRTDYDALRRTTRVSSAVADYRYGYDDANNRTYMQRWHQPGQPAEVYQYDGLYQLTQVWYGADATEPGSISTYDHLQRYDLDIMGNRLEVENDGVGEIYLPNDGTKLTNPMNRYEQVDANLFIYDLRGNTLTDGVNAYSYDILNQQIGMAGPGGTAEYIYDAQGQRIARTVVSGTVTTTATYVYDTRYRVLEERAEDGSLTARYTYGAGIDEPLTMERDGITYFYHRDALGSVTEVTDMTSVLVERHEYDVYGEPRFFDGAGNLLDGSAIGNPYLFVGRRYDSESSNYYYRARMYASGVGRFLQPDKMGYVNGENLYNYVGNNSVNFSDPTGLFVPWVHMKITSRAFTWQSKYLTYIQKGNWNTDSGSSYSDKKRHFDDNTFKQAYQWIDQAYEQIRKDDSKIDTKCCKEHETLIRSILVQFGGILHTIQDFYAHSNYVELQLGVPGWTGGLISGSAKPTFAKLWESREENAWWYTRENPTTHAHLNKDRSGTLEGGVRVGGRNLHEYAVDYATRHTLKQFTTFSNKAPNTVKCVQ